MIISVANHVCHAELGASLCCRTQHQKHQHSGFAGFQNKCTEDSDMHRCVATKCNQSSSYNLLSLRGVLILKLSGNVLFQHHVSQSVKKTETSTSLQFYSNFFSSVLRLYFHHLVPFLFLTPQTASRFQTAVKVDSLLIIIQ